MLVSLLITIVTSACMATKIQRLGVCMWG